MRDYEESSWHLLSQTYTSNTISKMKFKFEFKRIIRTKALKPYALGLRKDDTMYRSCYFNFSFLALLDIKLQYIPSAHHTLFFSCFRGSETCLSLK